MSVSSTRDLVGFAIVCRLVRRVVVKPWRCRAMESTDESVDPNSLSHPTPLADLRELNRSDCCYRQDTIFRHFRRA
jgi:hypothetical protein